MPRPRHANPTPQVLARRERRARLYEQTRLHGLPAHVPHGATAYSEYGCRCDVCTPAATAAVKASAEKRNQKTVTVQTITPFKGFKVKARTS